VKPLKTFENLPLSKQEKIMGAALKEFGEKGYQGASINVMVKHLGISKGSIYQYFKDKEALFLYVFASSMDMVKQNLRAIRDQSMDQPLSVRLKLTLGEGVHFIENHPDVYKLYVTLQNDWSMPMRNELLQALRTYSLDYIGSFLENACDRGELRQHTDIAKAGFVIDAIMDRFLLSRTTPHAAQGTDIFHGDQETVNSWINSIVDMLCQGVIRG